MKFTIQNPGHHNICSTCGTRYASPQSPPESCPICLDERQYVGDGGQAWTSYQALAQQSSIRFSALQAGLYDLRIMPSFAIGQKAHLVLSPGGNILWDCLPFLDEPTATYIQALGGLQAIVISHPHYYSLMTQWARVFNCPVYLHAADRQWVQDPSEHIRWWDGASQDLWDGIQIIQVAGHFAGSTVLHLPQHGPEGSLLVGDSLYVTRDRKYVSFMYSYPNLVPLPRPAIELLAARLQPLAFGALYGAFEGQIIATGAREAVDKSIARYLHIFREN